MHYRKYVRIRINGNVFFLSWGWSMCFFLSVCPSSIFLSYYCHVHGETRMKFRRNNIIKCIITVWLCVTNTKNKMIKWPVEKCETGIRRQKALAKKKNCWMKCLQKNFHCKKSTEGQTYKSCSSYSKRKQLLISENKQVPLKERDERERERRAWSSSLMGFFFPSFVSR